MAFDTYMKIDGIDGESQDDRHKDWIELLSFSHSFTQPASATASSAGGATAGRVDMGPYTVVKYVDRASAKLYEACCTGKHIKEVTIEMCRAAGDDKVKYLEVKMEAVLVGGVDCGGNGKGNDILPTESISLVPGKIKWSYTLQKRADGSGGGQVIGGWDCTANKKWA